MTMHLNTIQPAIGSKKTGKRLGRGIGSGRGKTSGKGHKGQHARAGGYHKLGFEGGQMPLYRRIPKLKHFPLVNQQQYTLINVEDLAELGANTEVNLATLMDAGIVTTDDGPLKILGNGNLTIALKVQAAAFTASAKEKIEAAGGTCEVLS